MILTIIFVISVYIVFVILLNYFGISSIDANNFDANILSVWIAAIEITLAIIIYAIYRYVKKTDQEYNKKYEYERLCETLNTIHGSIGRLYQYKLHAENYIYAENEQYRIDNNIRIMESQIITAGTIFNHNQLKKIRIIRELLSKKFVDLEPIEVFLIEARPCASALEELIKLLNGDKIDNNQLLYGDDHHV
ncbi:MAG: putative membrane protein [Cenarchaeum symbiont of Oopsacas minuta]|nr:putative membrane protein [Cenarchaeum symbiont of Oopsacas minuta]